MGSLAWPDPTGRVWPRETRPWEGEEVVAQCSDWKRQHTKLRWERGSTQQTPLCARTRSGAKTKKLLLSPHFPRFPRLPENLGLRFSAAELNSDAGLLVEAISSWRRAKQSIDICSVSYIYKQSKFLPVPQSRYWHPTPLCRYERGVASVVNYEVN